MSGAEFGRVAVLGMGAIGGWAAGRLALSGADVRVLARGETFDRLRSEGLRLEQEGRVERAQLTVARSGKEIGAADLLILAVKAPALAQVVQLARPMIGPDTIILPMLNGVPWWLVPGEPLRSVDPDGSIARSLPEEQLIGCVVHAACSRAAPNHVIVKFSEGLILGEPGGGSSDRLQRLSALFGGAGIQVEESDDVRRAIWYKLWGNATINPLSALTRSTADRLLADAATRQYMLDAMEELAAIGAAIGCPISQSGPDRMEITARLGAFKTSMLQDVEAGRPIELEALLGAPIEIARKREIPTPQLDRLYGLTGLLADSLGLR